MNTAMSLVEHADAGSLAAAVAAALEQATRAALAARGRAFLALAGGSTPLPAYRLFAQADLDWNAVTLVPTDERWVPHGHPACNLRTLREAFAAAEGVELVALTPSEPPAEAYAATALRALARRPAPFDAVLLGMGEDGHTASLFPGSEALDEGLAPDAPDALVLHPRPLPAAAPWPRVSLSAARLRRTRSTLLAIGGQAKREVLASAARDADAGRLPVAALLHAPVTPVQVHWSP